jgi:hypothetical protein
MALSGDYQSFSSRSSRSQVAIKNTRVKRLCIQCRITVSTRYKHFGYAP